MWECHPTTGLETLHRGDKTSEYTVDVTGMTDYGVPLDAGPIVTLTQMRMLIIPALALVMGLPHVGHVEPQGTPCPALDTTAAWARVNRSWSREAGLRWSNDSLRRVLLTLRDRDQALRAEYGARAGDTLYVKRMMTEDSLLAIEMDGILSRFGLPTRTMVGPAGSDAAMLVIQHNWPLQERVLALAKALPPGEISPEKLGMLEDRVLVHQGKPQRFGTQFTPRPDGVFRFAPVSEPETLDARRSAAGMPPMLQYVCMFEESGLRVDRTSLPPPFRP